MNSHAPNIIGESPQLAAALDHISRLAAIDRPVLIIGERGTGKELAAERLHYLSTRWDQTFTKINCSAIAETLLESELFGHEAGAFTGATKQHIGRFELTDGGTLFLDELATMSLRLQEKLLRVIEYGEFERVGGQKTLQVDVRLVAATNADLPSLADEGVFRWDLLDRLSFDVVHLPPLRERDDDLYELAQHFSVRMCRELGWDYFPGSRDAAIRQLSAHHWPGNIRELKNVVIRASILFPGSTVNGDQISQNLLNLKVPDKINKIQGHDLTDDLSELEKIIEETAVAYMTPPSPEDFRKWFEYNLTANLRGLLSEIEITMIEAALESEDRNIAKAASKLTINRTTLIEKIKKYGIE